MLDRRTPGMEKKRSYKDFLQDGIDRGGFMMEDIIAAIVPLFNQVRSIHEDGKVAQLTQPDKLVVEEFAIHLPPELSLAPKSNPKKLDHINANYESAFEITGEEDQVTEVEDMTGSVTNLDLQDDTSKKIIRPVYLPGYSNYEVEIGHHDALTDIYSLGLYLAGISFGLDFSNKDEFKTFVDYREDIYVYNSSIHPVIAQLITDMTELNRSQRARDLDHIILQLENYKNYDPENELDLSKIAGFETQEISTRRNYILDKLKNRLFDLSKRNKLLHFKENLKFINLTVSSVPIVLDYKNIRSDSLFLWNENIATFVTQTKPIPLSKFIPFTDKAYAANTLSKIRSQAIKTRNELGFNQLRMVVAFLRWHNLKENKEERINSPLLLIPAELTKKKGVKDQFVLTPTTATAEVNPILVHYLKELYGITLPDAIHLDEVTIPEFYENLKKQISQSKAGITIDLVEKPKIKLIHALAKRTYNLFQRKLRGRETSTFKSMAYSYSIDQFKPLGLEIFKSKVKRTTSGMKYLLDEDARLDHVVEPKTKKREFYQLEDGLDETSPYNWEVDLCNITLGNFDYRKMSLVGDYNHLLTGEVKNPVFDDIFSLEPKSLPPEDNETPPLSDQYHVVASDPTQTKAISFAGQGESFIIQGPPGTGKSQTITNLISDYIARDKKVLFICEKRAAIDVVYYRLKQQGLDELCCRIHDSQADKKSFVMDLKESYDRFLAGGDDLPLLTEKRKELITELEQELSVLRRYSQSMEQAHESIKIPFHELIKRLIELKEHHITLSDEQMELLPEYGQWLESGDHLVELTNILKELGEDQRFALHPASTISDDIINADNPVNRINHLLQKVDQQLNQLIEAIGKINIEDEYKSTLGALTAIVEHARHLEPFTHANNFELLNPQSVKYAEFIASMDEIHAKKKKLQKEKKDTVNWKEKLTETDLKNALELIDKHESSIFSFLNSDFRAVKKSITERYDFSKHAVKPSLKQVLVDLKEEYEASEALREYELEKARKLNIKEFTATREALDTLGQLLKAPEAKRLDYLINHKEGSDFTLSLLHLSDVLDNLVADLEPLVRAAGNYSPSALKKNLTGLRASLGILPDILPAMQELLTTSPEFVHAVKTVPMNEVEAEAAFGRKSLHAIYRTNRNLAKIEGRLIEQRLTKIEGIYEQLFDLNAKIVKGKVREKFVDHVNISSQSASTLAADQKKFKKSYNAGRKKLEHEFNKVMRYKPIRELVSTESGQVIKDLKPVWLMSPLSVCDTLPINSNEFDVVIFDEASQITLEEGIPSIFRARQAIIVGDEMQMPPTNFFSSKGVDNDDLDQEEEGHEEVELDADSLLSQAASNLSSRLLGWHYRSRHEALIGFSNAAFYGNQLLTIPDNTINTGKLDDILIENLDAQSVVSALFNRSISFHKLEKSIYEDRTNKGEAQYIANLVRDLLMKEKKGYSIGIVAFSKEQQIEIENALTNLAQTDEAFQLALEKEYERVEDDQFVGLIVKNLENIQGDERDLIIMSVCYGYNDTGKMRMNFGPINRNGGEKRLNVIFSRAKKHMAIVSSIRHYDIKNEYNEGANYFRKFLQYAELVSRGNSTSANLTLKSLSKNQVQAGDSKVVDVITRALAKRLTSEGYQVELGIGQSYFKCNLGVVAKDNKRNYQLGILIDDSAHYQNKDILEQYYLRPSILRAFGWKMIQVYSKDWYENEEVVFNRIRRLLGEKVKEDPIEESEELLIEPPIPKTETLVPALPKEAEIVASNGSEVAPANGSEAALEEEQEEHTSDKEAVEKLDVVGVLSEQAPNPEPPPIEGKEAEPTQGKNKSRGKVNIEKPAPNKKVRKTKTKGEIQSLSKTRDENYVTNPAFNYAASTYYEFSDDRSFKFWEVAMEGVNVGVRYGRIGTKGQVQLKTFDTPEVAQGEMEKLIRSKVRKGYLEIG